MSEIDHIQAALEQARANIRDVRTEIDSAAPPCKMCRYVAGEYDGDCGHPAVIKISFDATTGAVSTTRERLWKVRSNIGLCGKAGTLFESAPAKMLRRKWVKRNLCWFFPIGALAFLACELWFLAR